MVSKIQADSEGSALGFGLGFLQHSIPEDIVASKSPGSSFIRTQSVSRVSMDPLLSGGVELQEQLRAILDSWVHGRGLWSKYEKFWRRQHGRTVAETSDFVVSVVLEDVFGGFEFLLAGGFFGLEDGFELHVEVDFVGWWGGM